MKIGDSYSQEKFAIFITYFEILLTTIMQYLITSSLRIPRHKVRKGVSASLLFFVPPSWYPPLSLETCTPTHPPPSTPPSSHPSQENTRFYVYRLESGRLKTINIKPWKSITLLPQKLCLKYWVCPDRYHSDN